MTAVTIRSYKDIKGWFFWDDRALFDVLLDSQDAPGTLVELGAYLGRSAVIVGNHLRDGERFVVIDLFGSEVELTDSRADTANRNENRYSYATLTRTEFEQNYRALHDTLPTVVQAPSTAVLEHVPAGTARFVHIDASHMYTQVAEDVVNARTVLQPDGIVVFDDFSNPNTPGVAAAVWEGVVTGGLVPFAATRHKMYATFGDPAKHLDTVRAFAATENRIGCSEQEMLGHDVLRLRTKPAEPSAPAPSRPADPPLRRSDLVPPVVARWVRRRRAARG
jgi:predicted O-methyltransferase YrrM